MSRISTLVVLLLVSVACGEPEPTTETLTDVGVACLHSDGTVRLDFETCLSSSCDTLISATCAGSLDGDTLTITSEAVIESQGEECTDDCGFVGATCTGDAPAIADGVTVSIGGETAALAACDES
jgi:hypothetical protein